MQDLRIAVASCWAAAGKAYPSPNVRTRARAEDVSTLCIGDATSLWLACGFKLILKGGAVHCIKMARQPELTGVEDTSLTSGLANPAGMDAGWRYGKSNGSGTWRLARKRTLATLRRDLSFRRERPPAIEPGPGTTATFVSR